MSVKIVFNGQEYTGVEAMPPVVRREYEATLALLRNIGERGLVSRLLDAVGVRVQATIRRKIVVNGKEYASVDELPPELRQRVEQTVATLVPGGGTVPAPTVPPRPVSALPPVVLDDQARRTPLVRIAWWLAIGVLVALWLLRRG